MPNTSIMFASPPQLTASVDLNVGVVMIVQSVILETVVSVYARVVLELTASVGLTASAPRKV